MSSSLVKRRPMLNVSLVTYHLYQMYGICSCHLWVLDTCLWSQTNHWGASLYNSDSDVMLLVICYFVRWQWFCMVLPLVPNMFVFHSIWLLFENSIQSKGFVTNYNQLVLLLIQLAYDFISVIHFACILWSENETLIHFKLQGTFIHLQKFFVGWMKFKPSFGAVFWQFFL